MSIEAYTTVQRNGRHITDQKLKDFLWYLADAANADLTIDPAPRRNTMANEFGVSNRTIKNWLDKLTTLCVIKQTRIGSGPGNPSAYLITLPDAEIKAKTKGETKGETDNSLDERVKELERKVEEMAVIIATFQHQKGETERVKRLQLKGEKGEKGEAKGGNATRVNEHPPLSPHLPRVREDDAPPVHSGFALEHDNPNPKVQAYLDEITAMENALVEVCKLDISRPPKKLDGVAKSLVEGNYDPEQIRLLFGSKESYWYKFSHGKKDGMPPYLGNIPNEIRRAIQWLDSGPKSPNTQDPKEIIWSIIQTCGRDTAKAAKMFTPELKKLAFAVGDWQYLNMISRYRFDREFETVNARALAHGN